MGLRPPHITTQAMDIETIIISVITTLFGGGIGGFVGWRAKKRQDNANASKTEQEAKGDQIENIEKMVEKAYKPIIEDLTERIQRLQEKVEKLEAEKDEKDAKIDELEGEVMRLRSVIRELAPDRIPSLRGENGKSAPRSKNGRFTKKEEQS